jgi:endo-1,4-beta-D-glucanase Y
MTALPPRRASRGAVLLSLAAAAAGCAATPTDPAVGGGGDDPGPMPTPFGSHSLQYPAGSIRPTGAPAQLDAAVAAFYDRWRAAYVREGCGGFYVRTGGGTGATSAMTVSEGHGYGMIAAAIMAGHDPQARDTFDGFFRFFRAVPSAINRQLMSWAVNARCEPVNGTNSATDGDLDIAFALLLANRQWGSDGAVNYLGEARRIIDAIDRSEIHRQTRLPLLGDWATDGTYQFTTRPSDFMLDHFRAFAAVSGNGGWLTTVERIYGVVASIQGRYSTATGLLPDFVINTHSASPGPPLGRVLESDTDDDYSWNSCRVPWRLGTDYVVSGDARAKAALDKITAWIRASAGGDPAKVVDGYRLDGSQLGEGDSAAYIAPFGVAAMADAGNQAWLDEVWRWLVAAGPQGYYADSIKLLSMIVMSGNWWAP